MGMMGKENKMLQNLKHGADDLEPYRRLIEVQKQLAEMARKHEQARRECEALRERMAREVFESIRWQDKLRYRLRLRAHKILRRLPRLTARDVFRILNLKEPFSC
jgi:hypothetical protein